MAAPQFDPNNPDHVHNALRELHAQVAALDIAKQELIDKNTDLDVQVRLLKAANGATTSSGHVHPNLHFQKNMMGSVILFDSSSTASSCSFLSLIVSQVTKLRLAGFDASLLRGPALIG